MSGVCGLAGTSVVQTRGDGDQSGGRRDNGLSGVDVGRVFGDGDGGDGNERNGAGELHLDVWKRVNVS